MGRLAVLPLAAAVLILVGFLGFWKVRYDAGHEAQGQARDELWAVPAKYDGEEPEQAGTVEEVVYDTRAYATDGRNVKKSAYVYLPYGYSKDEQYNILYLMHGTGDDEKYWLKTNQYNKTMLDNMISDGDIDGVDLLGYTVWGCIDCVSFGTGEMKKRYGFIYVDKDNAGHGTLARSKKDSFDWYKKVIESNGEKL